MAAGEKFFVKKGAGHLHFVTTDKLAKDYSRVIGEGEEVPSVATDNQIKEWLKRGLIVSAEDNKKVVDAEVKKAEEVKAKIKR